MAQVFDADAVLSEGRTAYRANRHIKALECFTRVMKHCPCARGSKRERCRCKNFEAVAEKKGSIFHEAMYTCSCVVGKTFNKCDAANHVHALDYRAATFEAMRAIGRAQLDAEWLLELAPRLPEGYLRLGKLARLQKKNEFAWHIYNAGIEATKSSPRSPLIEKLYEGRSYLSQRFAKRDPITLPAEVLQMILELMDFVTLARCAQVSRAWRRFLTTGINQALWRTMHFDVKRSRVSLHALSYLLKNSNHSTDALLVEHCGRTGFARRKFEAVMLAAQNIERLELRRPSEAMPLPEGGTSDPGIKIRHLVLDGFSKQTDPDNETLPSFRRVCKELESLELINNYHIVPARPAPLPENTIPSLKYLRISSNIEELVPLLPLAKVTPNLEQLWLECGLARFTGEDDIRAGWWLNLKAFVYLDRESSESTRHLRAGAIVGLLRQQSWASGMQHVDIELRPPLEIRFPVGYTELEALRLKDYNMDGGFVNMYFGPSVAADKLHTFSMEFPQMRLNSPEGQQSSEHLDTFKWMAGKPSIRRLFVRGFSFHRWDDPVKGPFPTFLASFPNLEEIIVSGNGYTDSDFCAVIEGITKACKALKIVWQDQIKGVMMDRLVELAKKEGVEVRTGEPRREWPVKLEN